ncbi:unnamed protein product [Rotaria sordida]|uniref:Uncharacterized protein n=1 Tax=Rotaria sordida TaxID=392033 RepID=A0A815PG62_9BILA|nr:unnamed protein product [Rotaria sordida]CAF1638260.1 unnamed protein product [Rotaria sordida]
MFIFYRTFVVFGGYGDQRFSKLQSNINQLLNGDKGNVDDEASPYYQQLLDSIKYFDVCFNIEIKSKDFKGWSSSDIVVDKDVKNEQIIVFVEQYAQTSKGLTMLIGVLSFGIQGKGKLFVINQLGITTYNDKTSLEYEFLNDAAQHFQSHSTALGGIKCEGDPAMQLLNYSRDLFRQIEQNFYKSQQSLSDSDQEMCKH